MKKQITVQQAVDTLTNAGTEELGAAFSKVRHLLPSETVTVDDAVSVIHRDYFDDVLACIEEVKRAIKDGEITEQDEVYDFLHEMIDGHQRVIYTFRAKLGMLATENPDAFEDLGMENATIEQRMYCAMMQDVQDRMPDEDELFGETEQG